MGAPIRFVAWNVADRFHLAAPAIQALRCLVGVFAEVRADEPSLSNLDHETDWRWVGDPGQKGLALAGFDVDLGDIDVRCHNPRFSLWAHIPDACGLLGLWSCPRSSSSANYRREINLTLDYHEPSLKAVPSIVVGDFNILPTPNDARRRGPLTSLHERFNELGYVSAYHATRNRAQELPGEELQPTYFHQWNRQKPFHLDLCFVHHSLTPRITDFEIGTYEHHVRNEHGTALHSDHTPLSLTFAPDTAEPG